MAMVILLVTKVIPISSQVKDKIVSLSRPMKIRSFSKRKNPGISLKLEQLTTKIL